MMRRTSPVRLKAVKLDWRGDRERFTTMGAGCRPSRQFAQRAIFAAVRLKSGAGVFLPLIDDDAVDPCLEHVSSSPFPDAARRRVPAPPSDRSPVLSRQQEGRIGEHFPSSPFPSIGGEHGGWTWETFSQVSPKSRTQTWGPLMVACCHQLSVPFRVAPSWYWCTRIRGRGRTLPILSVRALLPPRSSRIPRPAPVLPIAVSPACAS